MKAAKEDQERLLALQQIDTDLLKIDHKLKNSQLSLKLEVINGNLISSKNLIVAAETEKSDIQHELSRSEIDVEQVVSRIERDEKRLASGSGTPKELEQIQHELGTLGKRRAELEDVELEIMVRIEDVNSRIKSLQEEVRVLEEEFTKMRSEFEEEKQALDAARNESSAARASMLPTIDKELLALYEKIRSSADGVGAARLIGDSCDGCHLKLNAAEIERVKSLSDDEVIRCEECRRILIRVK